MGVLIWLGIMVVFLVLEAITVGLVTIWFAIGALAALIACALGMALMGQITIFFLVSLALLCFTRPLAVRYINPHRVRTNYEDAVDKVVKITECVDNRKETGTAILNGQEWMARTQQDGLILPEGAFAKVAAVEGVKLILVPAKHTAE